MQYLALIDINAKHCRTGRDRDGLKAKIAKKNYRYHHNYAHHTSYRSCPLIYGITIIRLLSFLFLDDFE